MTHNRIFIDTSFFKALLDTNDDFHLKASQTWSELIHSDEKLLTTNYILDESYTLLRIRSDKELSFTLKKLIVENVHIIDVIRVTSNDEIAAWQWFEKDWSKLSFTDCVSFALMKRLGLKQVLSFDNHFKRAGFSISS